EEDRRLAEEAANGDLLEALPAREAGGVRAPRRLRHGLRLRGGTARRLGPSVLLGSRARGRPPHDALPGGRLPGVSPRAHPRDRPRPLRAGALARPLRDAARRGLLDRRPREPVAPLGEPGRTLGAVLALLLPEAPRDLPRSARGRRRGRLPPRDQRR